MGLVCQKQAFSSKIYNTGYDNMKILVINSGSSSIKFQLLDMATETTLASGLVERIGEPTGQIKCTLKAEVPERVVSKTEYIADHTKGMHLAIEVLTGSGGGVIADRDDIAAIGHRVVHGGEDFQSSIRIDDTVLAAIEKNIPLAPLHNPANLAGIRVARELFPKTVQVAVFDTAFHQTIPPHAYHYAIPQRLYLEKRIRRYGFHGTSHKYVAGECARAMGRAITDLNLITIHLGNGSSITAVEKGNSVDTSLGLTPLEGLVMGTRCGDIDPAIHAFLARNCGMDIEQIDRLLNNESGLKGLCGYNDMRDIHAAIENGDESAKLALAVQTYRTKKYIGGFMAVLGRVDGIVFTAGIGENDKVVRAMTLAGLECFGIRLDQEANEGRMNKPTLISHRESRTQVWVIPTNEELAIARETITVLQR
jgi:acetate kinase